MEEVVNQYVMRRKIYQQLLSWKNDNKDKMPYSLMASDELAKVILLRSMPQAVDAYVTTRNFTKVDTVKRAIISLYRNDIQKYAENEETRVTSIFDQIPSQLQKHAKRL